MDLLEHLERRLGRTRRGWTADADGRPLPFLVGQLGNGELPDVESFVTTGLSEYPFDAPDADRRIRLELLLSVRARYADGPYPAVLQRIALDMLRSGRPPLRGQVLGPRGAILPGSALESFYLTTPCYYDAEFGSLESEGGFPVALAWLVPVARAEAAFVRKRGWDAFEDELERHDPDLLDPFRDPLPLPSRR
ncbi:suppressor of fused domain protein [Streptomyces sp. AJS327]|uniref:suppressor of fused domain protein n=1 Tax=Streptomyces sp. AJS327 TaxID=2545265 RepID=UPI0015DD5920|nr:suppressor of fused domain protein [Streptomyces sp. AJS327]